MGDGFCYFGAGDTVVLGVLEVVEQGSVGDALGHECSHGDEAAVAQRQQVVAAPHLSEEDVVVGVGKFGGELAELLAPGRLYYFLLCHSCSS